MPGSATQPDSARNREHSHTHTHKDRQTEKQTETDSCIEYACVLPPFRSLLPQLLLCFFLLFLLLLYCSYCCCCSCCCLAIGNLCLTSAAKHRTHNLHVLANCLLFPFRFCISLHSLFDFFDFLPSLTGIAKAINKFANIRRRHAKCLNGFPK